MSTRLPLLSSATHTLPSVSLVSFSPLPTLALLLSVTRQLFVATNTKQIPEEGKFLKGLAVLDDIAYFGVTTWAERSVRDSPNNQGELAAYDLVNNRLLWRRTVG